MRFKVFGVLYDEGWVNDGGEGFVGEIAAMKALALTLGENCVAALRLLSLEDCEGGLDLVVLVVLVLNVVIYTRDFLRPRRQKNKAISRSIVPNLLQHIYELAEWFVCPVFDLVPVEGSEVLINRFCRASAAC